MPELSVQYGSLIDSNYLAFISVRAGSIQHQMLIMMESDNVGRLDRR